MASQGGCINPNHTYCNLININRQTGFTDELNQLIKNEINSGAITIAGGGDGSTAGQKVTMDPNLKIKIPNEYYSGLGPANNIKPNSDLYIIPSSASFTTSSQNQLYFGGATSPLGLTFCYFGSGKPCNL